MKIECTVEELKKLVENKTSVAGTTDDNTDIEVKTIGLVFKNKK